MRKINSYITEKLHLNDNINIYNYHPKDSDELKKIVKHLIEERGNKCDLNDINTSKITDMSKLFLYSNFNGNISDWDVSNVTNMDSMFSNCKNFNGDLSKWDVSNVTNMRSMFEDCKKFEGKGLDRWDVSNVTNMEIMFWGCNNSFDGKCIEHWDVSNVEFMNQMFIRCFKLNCDFSSWDVSKVKNMKYMFNACKSFEGKGLEKWNVNITNKKNMEGMFDRALMENNLPKWYIK